MRGMYRHIPCRLQSNGEIVEVESELLSEDEEKLTLDL